MATITEDRDKIAYEFDVLDEIILGARGYIFAFDQLLDVYEKHRRLYALESIRQAVEDYPQTFEEHYGAVLLFKRRIESALERHRLEPATDLHISYKKTGVGNIASGNDQQFNGAR